MSTFSIDRLTSHAAPRVFLCMIAGFAFCTACGSESDSTNDTQNDAGVDVANADDSGANDLGVDDSGSTHEEDVSVDPAAAIEMTFDSSGGELLAHPDGPIAGFALLVPPGAVSEPTTIRVQLGQDPGVPLAQNAFRVGVFVDVQVIEGALDGPVQVTLPYDPAEILVHSVEPAGVKVWRIANGRWLADDQVASTDISVTIEIQALDVMAAGVWGGGQ